MDDANATGLVIEFSKIGIDAITEILKNILANSQENKRFKDQLKLEEFKAKVNKGLITKKDLLGITSGMNDINTLQGMGENLYSVDVLTGDLENVLNKCMEKNIPISVVGDANSVDKIKVVCLDSDKEQLNDIAISIMEQKDESIYNTFEIQQDAIDSMSMLAEKNNITMNFFKNDDRKTYCQYMKSEENMVDNIHQQVLDAKEKLQNINTYVSYNLNLEDKFQFIVQDENLKVAKTIDYCDKSQLMEVLEEHLGYDELTANEVANKIYQDLENRTDKLNKINIAKIEALNEELIPLSEELQFDIPEYKNIDSTLSVLNNRIANIEYAMNLDDISENEKLNLSGEKDKLVSAVTNITNQKEFADGIGANKKKLNRFITNSKQKQLLKSLKINITLENESLAIKDYQFAKAVYKNDSSEHILITDKNTNKSLSYKVPVDRNMLENDLKSRFGISDKLVLSSLINKCEQLGYTNKAKVINVDRKYTIQADLSNSVTVTLGDKSVKCDLSDIFNAKKTLQREFGMSEKKANTIIEKAKKQNPQLDKVRNSMKTSKSSPLVNKKQKRGSI